MLLKEIKKHLEKTPNKNNIVRKNNKGLKTVAYSKDKKNESTVQDVLDVFNILQDCGVVSLCFEGLEVYYPLINKTGLKNTHIMIKISIKNDD